MISFADDAPEPQADVAKMTGLSVH